MSDAGYQVQPTPPWMRFFFAPPFRVVWRQSWADFWRTVSFHKTKALAEQARAALLTADQENNNG